MSVFAFVFIGGFLLLLIIGEVVARHFWPDRRDDNEAE